VGSRRQFLESTRQIELTARFESNLEGGTEVSLWLKEIIESDTTRARGRGSVRRCGTLRFTNRFSRHSEGPWIVAKQRRATGESRCC